MDQADFQLDFYVYTLGNDHSRSPKWTVREHTMFPRRRGVAAAEGRVMSEQRRKNRASLVG